MKTRFPLALLCVVALPLFASFPAKAAEEIQPDRKFPRFSLEGSQVRDLPPTAAGRHYRLMIGLPESYSKNPNKRYPVVFVTDGYWDFVKIDSIRGSLVYDKVVPEFIAVGIGYAGTDLDYGKMRAWELSPVSFSGNPNDSESGHAEDFLRTIEQEIIPLIDREYRTDTSYRVLGGASLGGLFTLYTMYTKPDLFQAYIAATPAVIAGNHWLLGYEEKFVNAGRTLKARLYMTVGGNEAPMFAGAVARFDKRVVSRKMSGLAYEFRRIEGERHGGVQWESYVRGLRFAFAPLAPESGPAKD